MSNYFVQLEGYPIDRGGHEILINVEGSVWAGTADVHTLANGDPGYPGSEPGAEIESVKFASGHWACRALIRDEGDLTAEESITIVEQMFDYAEAEAFNEDYSN
tara:strand:+ start:221 stop:532 length:312 start_codon:yes stop_codon:yes gene_type:complete